MLTSHDRCAPFTYDAWKSPETLAIMSQVAGVDLVPAIDLEIGHINISLANDKGATQHEDDDDTPIVGWHTDSYPFVCVLMLSDCTSMVGGETALRTGHGEIAKVRGPQIVSYLTLRNQNANNH